MKKFPETRNKLPTQARLLVTNYLLECLEGSKPNIYGSPTFTYVDVLGIPCSDPYISQELHRCFEAARGSFEEKHPLRWSNSEQCSYREGYPSAIGA